MTWPATHPCESRLVDVVVRVAPDAVERRVVVVPCCTSASTGVQLT